MRAASDIEKKGSKKIYPPYLIPFLSVLHNVHKRGLRPNAGRIKGLE